MQQPLSMIAEREEAVTSGSATLKAAMKDYEKLSAQTAERTLRFWQLHNKIEK